MRHIYRATDPSGKVWTRGTDHRTYTHALFVKPPDGRWRPPSFAGSRSLAEREAMKQRKWYAVCETAIVAVDNPRPAATPSTP